MSKFWPNINQNHCHSLAFGRQSSERITHCIFRRYSARLLRSINKMLQSDRAAGLTRLQATSNGNSNNNNNLYFILYNILLQSECVRSLDMCGVVFVQWMLPVVRLGGVILPFMICKRARFSFSYSSDSFSVAVGGRRFQYLWCQLNEMCPIECVALILSLFRFLVSYFCGCRPYIHSFIHCAN